MIYVVAAIVLGVAVFGYRIFTKRQNRAALLAKPLTDHQRALVREEVPLLEKLPAELRRPLEGKINLFLDQVTFLGCNGQEVDEGMELSIAAQACLLVCLLYTSPSPRD